jgi:hypothetical protein
MIGFVMVVGLLIVGGSLAVSGGGGLLSGGGRLFVEATPTPAPTAAVVVTEPGASLAPAQEEEVVVPKGTTANMPGFSCEDGAIKDLSRGRWFLSDVKSAVRETEDGTVYDQVYWRMDRQNPNRRVKAANAATVTMKWSTPAALKERFGDAIGRVQGDRALLITLDGPLSISANAQIEQAELEDRGIEQIRRVQLFEFPPGKVRTAIGMKGDSCARLGSVFWGNQKKPRDNSRVVLDIERFE